MTSKQKNVKFFRNPNHMMDLSFGPFSIDPSGTRLIRHGVEVKLRPQALQALKVLAQHGGQHVDYERMIAEAWGGIVVSRHTVDVTIREVKRTLQECGSWIRHRPRAGYCLEVPQSEELVRRGWHFWNFRSREGFEKALDCFQQAAAEGTDFRAFEGQAASYLMLAAYCIRPPREMYVRFLSAYRRAEAIAGVTPELRCNRAFGLHLFERKLEEAEGEYQQALREKPTMGMAYVRMSMLYATFGRLDAALECIARGYKVEPLLPVLPATEVSVRFWRREFDQGVATGAKAIELHPYLHLARTFYAQALEFSGRLDEAIEQYRLASVMSPDLPFLRALEGTCLVKHGRVREGEAILEQLDELRKTDYVDAYFMAMLRDALGQRDEAFNELARAVDENAAALYALDVDPKADRFRSDSRFTRLRDKLFGANGSVASSE